MLNGTGAENTLWNRTECNIRKYYCSEPSEAQGHCASSLKHNWAFPSLLPFLIFSSMWWSNSWWSGVGDVFPSHADPSLWSPAQSTFLVTPSCWCYCLLPLPAMGDRPTLFSSCLWGVTLSENPLYRGTAIADWKSEQRKCCSNFQSCQKCEMTLLIEMWLCTPPHPCSCVKRGLEHKEFDFGFGFVLFWIFS